MKVRLVEVAQEVMVEVSMSRSPVTGCVEES